jgi:hypothetical protein
VIIGYVGLIGHGKTMLAVDEARRLAARRGAILAANCKITPPAGVEFVQLTVDEDGLSVDQLEGLMDSARATGRGVVIVIDEIGIIMPARFWQSFPIALMYRISQSRKYATDLVWTSQDEEDVDAYLRRKTQWVYKVKAIPSPSPETRERGRRPWGMFVTQWRPGKIDKRDKRIGWRWWRYRRERESVYDTDELVRPPARLRESRGRSRRSGRSSGFQPDGQSIWAEAGPDVTRQGRSAAEDSAPAELTSGHGGAG